MGMNDILRALHEYNHLMVMQIIALWRVGLAPDMIVNHKHTYDYYHKRIGTDGAWLLMPEWNVEEELRKI